MKTQQNIVPEFATHNINLASAGLGAEAIFATDEFFAPVTRMLADSNPVFIPDKYDDNGKWMDGWESRRRRDGGHDHAIIRLVTPAVLDGFNVDTSHFTGNYPPACSIEGCLSTAAPDEETIWTELLTSSALASSTANFFDCASDQVFSHLKLNIYPDGGVARLRAFGRPHTDWSKFGPDQIIELSSLFNGGRIIAYNDAHYGSVHRLITSGRGTNMGDGWETRRRREAGNDWIIVELGHRGVISAAEIDTAFFKGNYPDMASLKAADLGACGDMTNEAIISGSASWPDLLSKQKLTMDNIHSYDGKDILATGPVTHIRMDIYPDGGISRLRLFGTIAKT